MNPGPPALEVSTIPLGYRGGGTVWSVDESYFSLINLAYAKAKEENRHKKVPFVYDYEFTDDTAMARSVAKSLIQHNKLNVSDMAKR